MGNFIGIGSFHKKDLILLFMIICMFLINLILGVSFSNNKTISLLGFIPVISDFIIIRRCYTYIGFIIISGVSYLFTRKFQNKEDINQIRENLKKNFDSNQIKINSEYRYLIPQTKDIIITSLINALYQLGLDFTGSLGISDLNFWIFELLYFSFFTIKYKFKISKLTLVCVSTILIIGFPLFLVSKFLPSQNDKNVFNIILATYKWYIIPIGILLFQIFNFVESFVLYKMKFFVEYRFENTYLLLFWMGIMGFIFSLIFEIILSCIKVKSDSVFYRELNGKGYFFQNFLFYLEKLKLVKNKTNYFLEVILGYILLIVINYYEIALLFFLFSKLEPIFYVLATRIYPFIYYFIDCFLIEKKYLPKIILSLFVEFFAVLATFVLLEFLEIKICGLNENLRRNIDLRGIRETQIITEMETINIINNNEDEYNNSPIYGDNSLTLY